MTTAMDVYIRPLQSLRNSDVPLVGGKNASLGEMLSQLTNEGIRVPNGFATTTTAFDLHLDENGLRQRIEHALNALNIDDIDQLQSVAQQIRQWVENAPLPQVVHQAITESYTALEQEYGNAFACAVRSSATAEDLPDASFAGQQESFLNIRGAQAVCQHVRQVFASLYNDRAIAYRVHQGFTSQQGIAISATVQQMVHASSGASGVMFTLDTESGFSDVVFISASWGLGETIVQGAVNPDEFFVHKPTLRNNYPSIIRRVLGSKLIRMVYPPSHQGTLTEQVPESMRQQFSLSDQDIVELAKYAMIIEQHYGRPMDIEWAKDGETGLIYILQARPETVQSRKTSATQETYQLEKTGDVLLTGRAIGQKITHGVVRNIASLDEMNLVATGDILVTDMTDPNWEPVLKRVSGLITNRGGRTCHAAIIARELGIPAIVGCGDATKLLHSGQTVTINCAAGDTGVVYDGLLPFHVDAVVMDDLPTIPTKIMINIGNPDLAFKYGQLPNDGVGLARLEFIVNNMIGIHPQAILNLATQSPAIQEEIIRRAQGYDNPTSFFIHKLAEGIGTIAAAFWPNEVIVRLSDFKSNEYRKLLGGEQYEPIEENPMLGFRGASRYRAEAEKPCLNLECQALKMVRDHWGLSNLSIMVPFVRTIDEAREVIDVLEQCGIKRGKNGLRLIMMCEIPANALLAEQFLHYFDGFSIGSNDLTQLTLGLDRDSGLVADIFDERNPAVRQLIKMAIDACHSNDRYIGICGQGPSDYPDFAHWLVDQGITSMSLNPDSAIKTHLAIAKHLANQAQHANAD